MRATLVLGLCLGAAAAPGWGCGATCLRDSDCDEGLVCSRDRCVVPSERAGDAGPGGEASAGSSGSSSTSAGGGGTSAVGASGGAGGRQALPSGSAGGAATGGRENLDASADADSGSRQG